MNQVCELPPGQRERADFPRFGMTRFAERFPPDRAPGEIQIGGVVAATVIDAAQLATLPRCEQRSDLHCVTTWSRRSLRWNGYRFRDFYEQLIRPLAAPAAEPGFVVVRAHDGYRSSLPLHDLLALDVLLADRLDDQPLTMEHGAPLRLVAPAHYGYKSVKHLKSIEFLRDGDAYRPAGLRFMTHDRARVALEERGHGLPGWLLRYLYRPLIGPTVRRFEVATRRYLESRD